MSERMWRRGPDGEIIRTTPAPPSPADDRADPTPTERRKQASLRLGLKLGFRDAYDHLGMVVLMSILFAFLTLAAAFAGQSAGVLLFGRLPGLLPPVLITFAAVSGAVTPGGPLAAGLFHYARKAAAREEPDLFDLSWGFRRDLRRSLLLGAAQAFGGLLLAGNSAFYLLQSNLAVNILGAMLAYLALFWAAMCLYQWPLLSQQDAGVGSVIKKSALLVLDNPGYTAGLLLLVTALTAALWVSVVGGALLWAGGAAMLATHATRELLRKYDILPPDPTLDPIAEETYEFGGMGRHE